MGFVHIDHVGIVAFTIEQAREILGDALGLELDEPRSQWPAGTYFAPEQTYNYFFQVGNGETQVEVLIPEKDATSGAARFLDGSPISMTTEDVIATARHAPAATVAAVHLEALNHCPMTRNELRRHLVAAGLDQRVRVPEDGELIT